MRRRDFITGIAGSAAAWPGSALAPCAVSAQEAGRIYHIGFMIPGNRQMPSVVTFFDELRRNGFVEGTEPHGVSRRL